MNLQQLEYIIAVDNFRHFQKAADKCCVTQATLSMMIRKLEEELGIKIFDRSKQPVKPTDIGNRLISQARKIIAESAKMKEIVTEEKQEVKGNLRIAVIPTLAPYLLPLFLKKFSLKYPAVNLTIAEYTTETIIRMLKNEQLDAGLLATPLNDPSVKEQPLFYEKYFLYVNKDEKGYKKQYVLPDDIDINRLWLLEEGHCMRNQILNLCELKKKSEADEKLHYEAGSIETLKNLVEKDLGITVIPELATLNLSSSQKKLIRFFKPPAPVREISLVTHREYIKHKLIDALKETILSVIDKGMKKSGRSEILEI